MKLIHSIKQLAVPLRWIALCAWMLLLPALAAPIYGQDADQSELLERKVTLELKEVTYKEALTQLQQESGVRIAYSDNLLPAEDRINLKAKEKPLSEVLDQLLKNTKVTYKLIGNRVVLVRKQGKTGTAGNVTIRGYVSDLASGERLIGASVYDANTLSGNTTNLYGFYSLTFPRQPLDLVYSFVGYKPIRIQLTGQADTTLSISLESMLLQEVEVVASKEEEMQHRAVMSTIDIPVADIKSSPAFLGENDVLKRVQMFPGVQAGTEGTSGMHVRGGSSDQNLILLDGVPVYHATHFLGLFSVFNADAIQSVKLIKAGFPSRYGGRLSSVLDIRMKEGNLNKLQGSGSLGLVTSKLSLDGPIVKGKTSFLLSARRTYFDLVAFPIIEASASDEDTELNQGLFFYDINAKINHTFSSKSRLYFSLYNGRDRFRNESVNRSEDQGVKLEQTNKYKVGYGNFIMAGRWNKVINKKLFSNTTLTYSRFNFDYDTETRQDRESETQGKSVERSVFDYVSGIEDIGAKVDFDFHPSTKHTIKFGAGNTYHNFTPGLSVVKGTFGTDQIDSTFGAPTVQSNELSLYFEDDIRVTNRLRVNAGLNFGLFLLDQVNYPSLQPRITANYLLHENWSLKGSYVRMAQFIHLLTVTNIGLPIDVWVPVTDKIKPMFADQVALGLLFSKDKSYEFSVEGYYKDMQNLIEYQDGVNMFESVGRWEDNVEVGSGRSFGAEVLFRKTSGKTNGWLGYTWSKTDRQFDNLNNGDRFPFRYDRRHEIKLAVSHRFSERFDMSANWIYTTGNAITIPTERYNGHFPGSGNGGVFGSIQPPDVEHIPARNNFRTRDFHRMDLSANFHKKKKWGQRTWSVGLYNAYSRANPFYHYFASVDGDRQLIQVSIFPVLPFASWGFKF